MSLFPNKKNYMDKKEAIRSVCRLISLNHETSDDQLRGHKIDQIRKKLRVICSIGQKKNARNSQQIAVRKISSKPTSLISLLLYRKNIQEMGNAQPQTPTIQSVGIKTPQIQNALKLRKIHTQYKQLTLADSSPLRLQSKFSNKTETKQKQNIRKNSIGFCAKQPVKICNVKQMLLISEKCINKRKSLEKQFKVSEQLKNLKKENQGEEKENINVIASNDWIIEQKVKCKNQEGILRSTKCTSNTESKNEQKIIQSEKCPHKVTNYEIKVKNTYKRISLQVKVPTKYKQFISFIATINDISINPIHQDNSIPFKFYIGKGNNDDLPRKLLKRRKWIETHRMKEANLVWTQRREEKFYELMQSAGSMEEGKKMQKKPVLVYPYKCNCKQITQVCRCGYRKLTMSEQGYTISKSQNKQKTFHLTFNNLPQKFYSPDSSTKIHNHLFFHQEIAYKKLLFANLKKYYEDRKINPFDFIPLTFHVSSFQDQNWVDFLKYYKSHESSTADPYLWIVKPGENSNRGMGITVQSDLQSVRNAVSDKLQNGSSAIVQLYIMPLLYNKRKFDIRCYVLVTVVNSQFKAYWYQQGYVRTSCKHFSLINTENKFIHLTNDAIQKHSPQYGKYEPGNKLSFEALSSYIQNLHPQINFSTNIYPQMVSLSTDIFQSCYNKLHLSGKDFCFQIFGLDFMIDQRCKVWLIEVNRNPCLETSVALLGRLIGEMLENAFKIAVDPIIAPSSDILDSVQNNRAVDNKFRLIVSKKLAQSNNLQQNTLMEMQSDSEHD